jgi:N-methylhydantoinase A
MSRNSRSARSAPGARLAVDIGGTFTDVVLQAGGRLWTTKVLTTPTAPETGLLEAMQTVLADASMTARELDLLILGTTLATNALIERKGAKTALITTAGFRDVVEIGWEHRFAQYDIFLDKPAPLVPRDLRFGVAERINVDGKVLRRLDEAAVVQLAAQLQKENVESVAVAFLQSYANPLHERRVRELLQQHAPGLWVTLSSDVCPEVREYERTSTACANAYVQPVMAGYLQRLETRLRDLGVRCPVYLMTSGGALTTLAIGAAEPVRLVESGPAGGAILSRTVAQQCGVNRALSFDMGGTTAKICFIDDFEPQLSRNFEFGRMYRFLKGSGLPIRIPVIEMVEIGAGGGSIARLDEMKRVQVGPDSAGSEPGPACYARGGTHATVTDADCVMGYLDAERFAGGRVKLDSKLAEQAVANAIAGPLAVNTELGALAINEIVTENMANAARVHAMELGKTVEQYTLIAFGGAAPLHAARLAAKLGIARVIVPLNASVGSALGFLTAPVAFQAVRSWHAILNALDMRRANALLDDMQQQATDMVRAGAPGEALKTTRVAYMRYQGQGHEIAVDLPAGKLTAGNTAALAARFARAYHAMYGRTIPNLGVEIMSWSVTVATQLKPAARARHVRKRVAPRAATTRAVFEATQGKVRAAKVYERSQLAAGSVIRGPALVAEDQTTVVVTADYSIQINELGYAVLSRNGSRRT